MIFGHIVYNGGNLEVEDDPEYLSDGITLTTREQYDLPLKGTVYGVPNKPWKITPELFEKWMEVVCD